MWLPHEAWGERLGQRDLLPSALVVGLVGWERGDAEMCQVGMNRDVLRIMGARVEVGSGRGVIREGLWEKVSSEHS